HAGQEHLHLLRRRVLRLVEHDERIIERVVGQDEIVRDVQRVLRGHANAYGLRSARWFDSLDVTLGATASTCVVQRRLAGEPKWPDEVRQSNIEHERIVTVFYGSAVRQPGRTPRGGTGAHVRDSPEGSDQEHDVVA